ncbi:outer membrane protein assembly factor BamA [Candidatus Uabimicrobium amorphum]|uniref:Outer membrane protein assembly factor BamA n=1 Tax=Uabimicrobium amorphum TaxID=2596890 RepID=A0A5S9IHC9_UABAM|nr:outer membrane protein assembly factor BamA [Candidatus Uabimicrobium amorphum]BBM81828.1 outer membrane protein assembly factor BamA [Candidatus Uabimicrobium amorphum]
MARLLLFIWIFSAFLIAQSNKVNEVEIKGLITVGEDFIKAKLETQPGKNYSPQSLRNDILKLHKLKLFSNIDVKLEQASGGLKVMFLVIENQLLGKVRIIGNQNITKQQILDTIEIDNQRYLAPYLLSIDKIKLKEFYQKESFLFVEISTKLVPRNGWVDVEFRIDEGPAVYISEINFFGNHNFAKGKLIKLLKTQETGAISSVIYNEAVLNEDLILIRNFYRSEGYLDARAELRDIIFSETREAMRINISINEGPLYKVNSVKIVGNTTFTEEELFARLRLKKDNPFKQADMFQDKARVERIYGENGFMNAKARPRFTLPTLNARVVDITYDITEGNEVYVQKIDISGNDPTKDRVIRDNITVNPGERFNMGKVEVSQQKLRRLNFFETIKMDLQDTPDADWKDIAIRVTEGRTGNLRFAAGITSDIGVVGEVSVTKRNFDITKWPKSFDEFFSGVSFTGAGQTLSVRLQAGGEILRFNVDFQEPRLLGYNIIFGVNLFSNERLRESFDEERFGGKITFGRNLDIDTRVSLSYRLENVNINNLDDDAPVDVEDVEGDNLLSSLIFDLTIDTRDDFILPARGYIFGVSYEIAGTALGGDHDFSKVNLRLAWFQTIYTNDDGFKHILSLGSRMGFALPHLDTDRVPIFERFFAGGASSIRGFEFRTVGPLDQEFLEDPLGGELLFVNTIEYSIPIFQNTFRMVLFSDFGSVAPEVGDVDVIFDEFRLSIGFGFRIKVPALGPRPFALDFGIPIIAEDTDDEQIFSFSFGKPF